MSNSGGSGRAALAGFAILLAAASGITSAQEVSPITVPTFDGLATDARGRVFAVIPVAGTLALARYAPSGDYRRAPEATVALGGELSYRVAFDRQTNRLFVLAPSGTISPVDPDTLQLGAAIADLSALGRSKGNVYEVFSGRPQPLELGAPGFHDLAVYTRPDGVTEFFVSGISQFTAIAPGGPGSLPFPADPNPSLAPLPRQIVVRLRVAPDGSGQASVVLFAESTLYSSRGSGLALGAQGRVFLEIPLPAGISAALIHFGVGFPEEPAQAPAFVVVNGAPVMTATRGMDSDAAGNVYALQEVGPAVTFCARPASGAAVLAIPATLGPAVCVETPGPLPGIPPTQENPGGEGADPTGLVTWDVGAAQGGEFLWVPTNIGLFPVAGPFAAPPAPVQ